MRLASAGLMLVLLEGLGAYNQIITYPERLFLLAVIVLVGASLALSNRGWVMQLVVPLPFVAFIVWWLSSYTWSVFPPLFVRSTLKPLLIVLGVVILGQLLTRQYLARTLLHTGYVAMGFTIYALIAMRSTAFTSTTPGLPSAGFAGGFGHKNVMAPCLLLASSATLCFEHRLWLRRVMLVTVTVFLVIGQTGTGLATGIVLLSVYWLLGHREGIRRALGASSPVVISGLVLIGLTLAALLLGPIVSLYGKDLTFTGRTVIWHGVIEAIKKRPLQGYGWGGVFTNFAIEPTRSINAPLGYTVAHSHNALLEMALRLGFVAVALWAVQYWAALRAGAGLWRTNEAFGRFILMVCLIVFFFGISEVQTVFGAWFGLTVLLATFGPKRREQPPLDGRPARHRHRPLQALPPRRSAASRPTHRNPIR